MSKRFVPSSQISNDICEDVRSLSLAVLLCGTRRLKNGCIVWMRNRDALGYGRLNLKGKNRRVSRLVLILSGRLYATDRSLMALHHCDNPPCVNPEHLYVGTAADNMSDACRRGRVKTGKGHGSTKYPARLVARLRKLHLDGHGTSFIARKFGMPLTTVHNIVYRLRRTYV